MKKTAFTLAEVLITLGIIGIIASMTLPTLIQKQQEKVKVTQLKKAYSILSQAFNSAVYDTFEPKDWGMGGMYDADSHIRMANKFLPYLNVSENCIGKNAAYVKKHCITVNASPDVSTSVRLVDGTTVAFRLWNGNCNGKSGNSKLLENVCGSRTVDLNNIRQPNLYGQDSFVFYLTNYGVIPVGTQLDNRLSFAKYCDKNIKWGLSYDGFSNGTACTAWVLHNENMEYLHCADLDWNGKKKCK